MNWNRLFPCTAALTVLLCTFAMGQQETPADRFALHNGDTVVFYGDSITEQRLYTSDIELYTLTRFPKRTVRFLNAGVGGDKVSGGWAGPVDLRLERDIYAQHPAMVTIMLGMNDGYYRPADPGVLSTYSDGYRHILDGIQSRLPATKITLIKPSPFDDVTRVPQWKPGYNTVLQQFGDTVAGFAQQRNTLLADMNAPIVQALTKAKEIDPLMAITLAQDRVHPGTGIHWLMAESVLKSWNAPATVTSVEINAAKVSATSVTNTTISRLLKTKGTLSWVQDDLALPLPLAPAEVDPFVAMAAKVSDLHEALNQQLLRVTGLAAGKYQLLIDERPIGIFTAEEWEKGVNLAVLDTPMLAQSRLVALDTERKNAIESMHFSLQNDVRDADSQAIAKKLQASLDVAFERQRHDAQPVPHRYTIVPVVAGK